ncbi:MAG: adenylyltransferase/cytidyltransferase family protein [Candidatus Lokiarchaeota archaeon]|nr:adenylyltransferase/cytidyltransferase family protein [Candidatus Lokiarchaeota archaeon]
MISIDKPFNIGVIHGRFQILHNDHMKYLMAGKNLCNHLIVGITNPDPTLTKDSNANPHRSKTSSNPLTFYERHVMIREALLEVGLQLSEFSIVPFPINFPELLKYYVPLDAMFFLSIYDDWGKQKKTFLESLGLNIHVLWKLPLEKKGISGRDLRDLMVKGGEWQHLVPKSVINFIEKNDIIDRLKLL